MLGSQVCSFSAKFLFPFLNTGQTFALFHSVGTEDSSRDRRKSTYSGRTISSL